MSKNVEVIVSFLKQKFKGALNIFQSLRYIVKSKAKKQKVAKKNTVDLPNIQKWPSNHVRHDQLIEVCEAILDKMVSYCDYYLMTS